MSLVPLSSRSGSWSLEGCSWSDSLTLSSHFGRLAKCDDSVKLQEAIKKAFGDNRGTRSIVTKKRVEVLGLDSLTS